ncbi:hypothetical protein FACS1894109_09650 [Spirochaetia bacterium]|nr:hypothetical protein FACS1894109_09650 [Spirochaetia bacterium]
MRNLCIFSMVSIFIIQYANPAPCSAQTDTNTIDNLLSLDINYLLLGIKNQGGGLGFRYEHKIFNYLSVKGGFGHTLFKTNTEDVYCAAVHISLFLNYYPFSSGLNKLYIGAGGGSDFMNYFGDGVIPKNEGNVIIFLTPIMGYKFYIKKWMLDFSFGYKIILTEFDRYDIKDYVTSSPQLGLGIKYFFTN